MHLRDNTILITGGGTGIGRGLAEAFHKRGNRVIVAGRGREKLAETAAANPGIETMPLDVADPRSIREFAAEVTARFPALNVLVNNAGIMRPEDVTRAGVADAEAIVTTNLLGPIRLTAALLPHLMKKSRATVMTVSSGLAFVPMASTPTYCATKAAIHSYSLSLREQLKGTPVEVIEIVPPYVRTHLTGEHQASDPHAMPLDAYIADTMEILDGSPDSKEVIIEGVERLRHAEARGNFDEIFGFLVQQGRARGWVGVD